MLAESKSLAFLCEVLPGMIPVHVLFMVNLKHLCHACQATKLSFLSMFSCCSMDCYDVVKVAWLQLCLVSSSSLSMKYFISTSTSCHCYN